ncbi:MULTISPECIES: DUF2789 domain-containing protein [Zoogloea]|jgi:hypothetical protein|uniref:DUF2789 domain-containing protein n=1 Tax=Zoogloea oleivorans TaxID=1552750 RepID=A0A6C2CN24_9RHOO|nr:MULTISPECIES: DUF2789 domain-containing protein [Zoogloea]MBT9496054.1 DUF2789 domain-containing protein [Zoogloea sp.]MDD2668808.1 DUF2789 domain-containing protein [Zoogloea sp.]MDY0036094.1 DUF2789 domain-containing protein [Zoogloea oleivorans]TYC54849.1 DUF2789 domain-containing protein [Zoogloea oleivorans]
MESHTHSIANLFAQLGLPNDEEAINTFIGTHAPLPHDVQLTNASFWTPAQATFLKTEIAEDADWSAVIDTLDVQLRAKS